MKDIKKEVERELNALCSRVSNAKPMTVRAGGVLVDVDSVMFCGVEIQTEFSSYGDGNSETFEFKFRMNSDEAMKVTTSPDGHSICLTIVGGWEFDDLISALLRAQQINCLRHTRQ